MLTITVLSDILGDTISEIERKSQLNSSLKDDEIIHIGKADLFNLAGTCKKLALTKFNLEISSRVGYCEILKDGQIIFIKKDVTKEEYDLIFLAYRWILENNS